MTATQQQQRDGIGALTTSAPGREAMPDAGAIGAARINSAETRAAGQMDEIVAKIGPRMMADAAQLNDTCASEAGGRSGSPAPTNIEWVCCECGCRTSGGRGGASERRVTTCEQCGLDRTIRERMRHTGVFLRRLQDAMAKPAPAAKPKPVQKRPVMVDGLQLVCSCGCTEFTRVPPMRDEPDTGVTGHRGGWDCDECQKFFEDPEADFVDPEDRHFDEHARRHH